MSQMGKFERELVSVKLISHKTKYKSDNKNTLASKVTEEGRNYIYCSEYIEAELKHLTEAILLSSAYIADIV